MNTVAKFEKVSYDQFKKDWLDTFYNISETSIGIDELETKIKKIYDNIKLPKRSTTGSAGHDIYSPCDFRIKAHSSILIPTGVNCFLKKDLVLFILPRSGLGTKNRFVPSNLVGVIDSDYINSQNQGHIFMKMVNDGEEDTLLKQGQAFCQGVIIKYYIADNNEIISKRDGGFGSTDKI